MNIRKPRQLTPTKFTGMTREEYDGRMLYVRALCYPHFKRVPGLLPNGLPDMAAMLAAVKKRGSAGAGMPQLSGIYRTPERPRTQAREMARRLRQGAASAAR